MGTRGLRRWWHFLWCEVNCDSHTKPWNVSGQKGSEGQPGCGEAATQRASHIPRGHGVSMLAACHLAVLSGIRLGVDAWMPGSTVVQGDTAPGKARAIGAVYGGGCKALKRSSSCEEARHPECGSRGRPLNCHVWILALPDVWQGPLQPPDLGGC